MNCMSGKSEFDDVTLAMSLPQEQREPILRAIEYERNPTDENCGYVCEVMENLYEIKSNLKKKMEILNRIDEVIKFSIRKNSDKETVKKYFKVAPPIRKHKIENPVELLNRLMTIFDDPMDFASCIEFNYKNLKDLMGDEFIEKNSDIISDIEYAPAVYMQPIFSS